MSTEQQAKETSQQQQAPAERVTVSIDTKCAANILSTTPGMFVSSYKEILTSVLSSGYDINDNESALLLSALQRENVKVIELLFAKGAQTACKSHVYSSTWLAHAYQADRRYTPPVADLLLEHTLGSQFCGVIINFIRMHPSRVSVFDNATSDELRAQFYIRCGTLPTKTVNDNIQKLCGEAGLWYPAGKDIFDLKGNLNDAQCKLAVSEAAHQKTQERLEVSEQALTDCQASLKNTQELLEAAERSVMENCAHLKERLTASERALADSKASHKNCHNAIKMAECEASLKTTQELLEASEQALADSQTFNKNCHNNLKRTEQALTDCHIALKNTQELLEASERSVIENKQVESVLRTSLELSNNRRDMYAKDSADLLDRLTAETKSLKEKLAKASVIINKLTGI